jgi:hypothetical protein
VNNVVIAEKQEAAQSNRFNTKQQAEAFSMPEKAIACT